MTKRTSRRKSSRPAKRTSRRLRSNVEDKNLGEKRDRATGQYIHTDDALCVCGHPLGEHTAASVGGKRPCIHGDFHDEGCDCEKFRKSRKQPESNSRLTSDKGLQQIIDAATRAGWRVEVTGGGHLVFRSADRSVPPIYTAKTPSDRRALQNIRSTLKRHGLVVPNAFPESVHPNYDVSGAYEDERPRDVYQRVPYVVEAMPDGEWRWEVGGATGREPSERMAHHAARRAIERRLAARSM